MSKELVSCGVCNEVFSEMDEVVRLTDDSMYHKDCVTLYSTGYCAFLDDEYLGDTENGDGEPACFFLEEGEYIEERE
ncbi:hypothetical protein EF53_206 [Enterococcus phage 53]|uniref:hypothetical protein n=1 Tax=Enterococcus phage 53 TaxID=3028143 RepID=UPI0012A79D2C|nr:hypothetical protein vBEfaHEF1TV_53 [Enterococcus phage vB_EfaH_EF1TV]WDQ27838.1 hypothetical protein EF53_206 [Enterococcus phage 53]